MSSVETFEVGDKIKHPKFGQGTIKQRWGEGDRLKVLVSFTSAEWGDKKLMVKQAKIKKVAVAERPALAPADESDLSARKAARVEDDMEAEGDASEAEEEEGVGE